MSRKGNTVFSMRLVQEWHKKHVFRLVSTMLRVKYTLMSPLAPLFSIPEPTTLFPRYLQMQNSTLPTVRRLTLIPKRTHASIHTYTHKRTNLNVKLFIRDVSEYLMELSNSLQISYLNSYSFFRSNFI